MKHGGGIMHIALKSMKRMNLLILRMKQDRSGVAAVEFALMVPIMLLIWIGLIVATDAMTSDKKVTTFARTLADLTTQMAAVSQTDLNSIYAAAESVMFPQAATAMGVRLTSFSIDGAGKVFVDWSNVPNDPKLKGQFAAHARCMQYGSLPTGLKVNRTSIILAEVTMNYQPSVAAQVVDQLFGTTGGVMPLSDQLYMRPRQGNQVTFNPPPAGNCPGFVS